MDNLRLPSKSSRKPVPRKSVVFLEVKHGVSDETFPLLASPWTSDEETSDLSDAAVLNVRILVLEMMSPAAQILKVVQERNSTKIIGSFHFFVFGELLINFCGT